jgi:hypothetical protein
MRRSSAVVLVVVLALLFIGGRDREPQTVEHDLVPTPAAVDPAPAVQPVPLEISETTPPPGWDPPDTAEEQLVIALGDLGAVAAYQAALAAVTLLVVLGLMYAIERRRHG